MSKLICNNPICTEFGNEILKEDVINNSLDQECCPKCNMPVEDQDAPKGAGSKGKGGPPNFESSPNPNLKLIAAIAAGVLVIGAVIFLIMRPSSAAEEPITTTEVVQEEAEQTPILEEPEPTPEPVKVEQPAPVKTQPAISNGSAPKGTQTLTVNGNTYKGEVLNGKPHGMGTVYYKQSTQISPKDLKKRMADAGDYLTGEFYEGNPVQGKLFDASNNVKEVIMIGR